MAKAKAKETAAAQKVLDERARALANEYILKNSQK